MDESAFRQARDAVAPRLCAFEKAMLACACSLASRRNIAERETVSCGAPPAREEFVAPYTLLRQNSAFALKLMQVDIPLPHSKEMKLQCGGLQGVQLAIGPAVAENDCAEALASGAQELPLVADVRGLVQAARKKFDGLQNLPYSAIIQSIIAHQIRRRRLPQ